MQKPAVTESNRIKNDIFPTYTAGKGDLDGIPEMTVVPQPPKKKSQRTHVTLIAMNFIYSTSS